MSEEEKTYLKDSWDRAKQYIDSCVVHGAEDLKQMLGLDKQPVFLEVGHSNVMKPRMTRTRRKHLPND